MTESLKILLLADNAIEAETIRQLLINDRPDLQFKLVSKKEGFLAALDEFQPDLILFDNSLPRFYAAEALSIIRQLSLIIPFILIIDNVSEEFAATIIKLGADDYILKDNLTKLPTIIDALLIHRRTEKEKMTALDKLIQSEERYRVMIERISDAFVALDKNWCYTYLNSKAEQILNRSPGYLVGKNIWAEFPDGFGQPFQVAYEKSMKEQKYIYLEEYYPPYDKWFENHIYPSADGISIYFRDITEKKKAEAILHENEKQLSSAAQIAGLAYWEYDISSRQFKFNDQFYAILKTTAEKAGGYLISASHYEELFIHPEDKVLVGNETVKAIKSEDPQYNHQFEYRIIYPGGDTGYIAVHYFTDKRDKEKPVRVFGTIQDITERKKAEQELKKSNERFEMASMATNDIIWDWDSISNTMWWNENFYRLFILRKEEVNGNIQSWYDRLHPDDLERVKSSLLKTIEGKANYWSEEYRFLKSNKEIVDILDRGYVLFNADKKPYRMIGSMFDITDRKRAAKKLYEMEQEILNQKIQEQKKITRAILQAQEKERNRIGQELHDNVCQILTGAKLYLSKAGKNDTKIKELVEYPMKLVTESIDEIRMLSSENVSPLKDVSLKDLVHSLVDDMVTTAAIKTAFDYKVNDDLLNDDLKLNIYRILQEQITNIIRHSGGTNASVSIKGDSDTITIIVADNGKGFDTTKKKNGIGISNILNRVDSFNGETIIESSPGKGYKMWIKIPY